MEFGYIWKGEFRMVRNVRDRVELRMIEDLGLSK